MGDASRMASKLSNNTVWMWFDSETHAIWSPQNLNLLVPRGWKLHPTVVSRGRHLGKWWDCSSGALWNNPVGFIRDRETCALPALCHERVCTTLALCQQENHQRLNQCGSPQSWNSDLHNSLFFIKLGDLKSLIMVMKVDWYDWIESHP